MGDHFEIEQKVAILKYLIAIIEKAIDDNEPDYYVRKIGALEKTLDFHIDLFHKDEFVKRIDVGTEAFLSGGISRYYHFTVKTDDHTEHTWEFKSMETCVNGNDPWLVKCVQFRSVMCKLLDKLSGSSLSNEIDRLRKFLQ